MKKVENTKSDLGLWLGFIGVGLIAILMIIPGQFRSQAGEKEKSKGFSQTKSQDEGIPKMWDIREQKESYNDLVNFRSKIGRNAVDVADVRQKFVVAEDALKRRLPNAKIEYNTDIRIPEVITPDVYQDKIEFLTSPSGAKRTDILRGFINQNNELVGLSNQQINSLKVAADYTNPDGNLSFVHFDQIINGIPVFRGEVKAGFTKNNQIIRVINNLAPGLDYGSLSTDFRDPLDAVKIAAEHIKHQLTTRDVSRNDATSNNLKTVFGEGDWATTAEKMYFPTEPGVAVPSWKILIWQPVNAYYVIVDAETGTVLWHKNITEDQTEAATYQVYNNTNAFMQAADSPAPLSPGPLTPTAGTQGVVGTRTNVTLIGNEAPNTFNNNGWINNGGNTTDGNNVEAGIDRDGVDGVDTPLIAGIPNRVFTSTWNPPPGSPAPGDEPLTAQAQRGAVTQMFYVMNRYHDSMYRLGFVEQANNFQADNFGRGGAGADRVSAEGQDSAGTDNANFSVTSDGTRGRMQMFLWTGPTPDYDGTGDAEVILHEVTHGTSIRLHGNGVGLGNNMSRGMGEGWSDFYAEAMLSEPTDPINGLYTTGGYVTHLIAAGFTGNYYYGIRRFPRAPITFLGTNGRPHNPFTFRYINAGCAALIDGSTSAFPRGPVGSTQCDQVHNIGEIWSSLLWEVRNRMVTRLGFTAGTTRVLQVVTDGMKLAPLSPTLIQERDAIIAAAAALPLAPEGTADVADVREGFRVRGMGFSASIQTVSPAAVTEAFDSPNARFADPLTVSDSTGDNDGFPEPGENVLLTIPVSNPNTGGAITSVMANVNGGTNVAYGTIADGATVTRQIPYTVNAATLCGALETITINVTSSIGAQIPVTKTFRVGAPIGGAPATFSNAAAITINDNAPATPYPSNITVSGLTGNKTIRMKINGFSHTFPADVDMLLVGPGGQKFTPMSDTGGTTAVTGVVFDLVDTAAAVIPTASLPAGDHKPSNVTAGDLFAAPAPVGPYLEAAPAGVATFGSVFGTSGATMNGTWSLYVLDDAGIDVGTIANGWSLTFESNDYLCFLAPTGKRSDFDGDGKTDLSVFRPSEGNWYLNRSTAGLAIVNYGISTDVIAPGDYDGDGKTDEAVFRASTVVGAPDFFVLNSATSTLSGASWGVPGDLPVVADYDGDNKDDFAVWRSTPGEFYVLNSTNGLLRYKLFGTPGDKPVPADYNGDNRTDFALYRPSTGIWYVADNVTNAETYTSFGISTDMPVVADYDGDAKDDIAVFRPSNGFWYIRNSTGGISYVPFGATGDVPVPGDYDGDGKYDQAVYRGGTWFVNRSTSGVTIQPFGLATDRPTPRWYNPQ
jgi:hypothetical protein